jgi:hypothetical protein
MMCIIFIGLLVVTGANLGRLATHLSCLTWELCSAGKLIYPPSS